MTSPQVAVVVPTIRESLLHRFLDAFKETFEAHNVAVIVVEDHDSKQMKMPSQVVHVSRKEIKSHLLANADVIATRGAAIRSYGWLIAYPETKAEIIVNLDDDVLPEDGVDVIDCHLKALRSTWSLDWFDTVPFPMRGRPYGLVEHETVLNHGLWTGDPDLDAYQRLSEGESRRWDYSEISWRTDLVPKGQMFAMCGMNTAVRTSVAKYLWQPKLPDGYRRWDDIWAGFVFKRVADFANWPVTSGAPFVHHERASEVIGCLRQEMLGYGINESLPKALLEPSATARDVNEVYRTTWEIIGMEYQSLAETARLAVRWLDLWE